VEIPAIFGTTEAVTVLADTASEMEVSKFMQNTWATFAKEPKLLTSAPFNFPKYNPETTFTENTLIGFAANNLTAQLLTPSAYDSYCSTIETLTATIPGGIQGAIQNVVSGRDIGIPGLRAQDIPDMSPSPLPAPPRKNQ
jgi:cholinesterase